MPRKKLWLFLLASLSGLLLLRLLLLCSFPLIDPTEGRYAEISRQMLATGNWVTPQLSPGEAFWGKPPLFFWLTAISLKIFGINEFGARVSEFLLSVVCILLTYLCGRRLLSDPIYAAFASLVLASSALFSAMSGVVATDMTLTASVTLVFAAFALSMQARTNRQRVCWGYLFFLGLGLSLLAKGLVGWVLPLGPIFFWILINKKQMECMQKFPWISGTLLMLAIGVPWHVMAEIRTPGFLYYYIVGEHFKRYFVSGWQGDLYGAGHQTPYGTSWGYLLVACLPWLLLIIPACFWLKKRDFKFTAMLKEPWPQYCLLWVLSPALLFSPASNVMLPYMLPSAPAFALLFAYLAKEVTGRLGHDSIPWFAQFRTAAATVFLVPVIFVAAAVVIMPAMGQKLSQRELVQTFLKLNQENDNKLVFVGNKPYSGLFYAQGRAKFIHSGKFEQIRKEFKDQEASYFALEDKEWIYMPQEMTTQTEEVAKFPKYSLRRELYVDGSLPK